ncbi:hypothetical protein SAMN05444166_7215 [Singulisphaera sp. GP187]|nr:hypothetical protein SAMN05444166_7215 [Singulisphaera sp. GP187]
MTHHDASSSRVSPLAEAQRRAKPMHEKWVGGTLDLTDVR